MKIKAIVFGLFAFSFLLSSCVKENIGITPSNKVTTVSYSISEFQDLEVSDLFKVYLTFSDTEESLQIETNKNLHKLIEIDQYNGKLSISLEDNVNLKDQDPVLNIFLSTNDLEQIQALGVVEVFLQNTWEGEELGIELSGVSSLEGNVNAEKLLCDIEGSSEISLTGNTEEFSITLTGASIMTGFEMETTELTAELEGASEMSVTVHDKMNVVATGASTLFYKGDCIIESQQLSGNSQVIKID